MKYGGTYSYLLQNLTPEELFGRSLIVHADEDDNGQGGDEESKITGNSGARIGCAVFGRAAPCSTKKPKIRKIRKIRKTRKIRKH